MPGKKKKSASSQGLLRPEPIHQDSLRRDIQAAIQQNHEVDDDDGGLDIADQLLATLDARDKAEEKVRNASIDEERALKKHHSSEHHDNHSIGSHSPLKQAGEKILHAGEKMFGHHSHTTQPSPSHSPVSKNDTPLRTATIIPTDNVDKELASDMQRKGSIKRFFAGHVSPKQSSEDGSLSVGGGKKKVSRQKARMERRAAEMEAQRVQAEEELKANGGKPDEAERERVAISDLCKTLKVEMHEITPDGHCLYAAVADQLNILGRSPTKLNYLDTRKATAEYMRKHSDDFIPFISDFDEHMAGIENKEAGVESHNLSQQEKYFMGYCDAIEKTAVWGGQPEILALSRVFETPIHVVQAGCPVVKVGNDNPFIADLDPVIISYHRHMYGLGEHYNSLHKATKAT